MLWKSPCPGGHVLADIFAGNDPAVCVLLCMHTDTHSFSSSVYAHSYYWCLHRASWVSTDKRLGLVVTRDTEADTEDARGRILPSTVVHWHSVNITTPAHFRKAPSWSSRQQLFTICYFIWGPVKCLHLFFGRKHSLSVISQILSFWCRTPNKLLRLMQIIFFRVFYLFSSSLQLTIPFFDYVFYLLYHFGTFNWLCPLMYCPPVWPTFLWLQKQPGTKRGEFAERSPTAMSVGVCRASMLGSSHWKRSSHTVMGRSSARWVSKSSSAMS